MREGTKAIIVVISDIFPIDSSTKEPRNDLSMIVYKKNIKYESVVLEITTKNSPTTIFPSCVTVRLKQQDKTTGWNNILRQETTG